jgi:hypothetical protein
MNLVAYALIFIMAGWFTGTNSSSTPNDPSVVFAGTTPCSNIIRPLHKIAEEADCKLNDCHCLVVEWKLTLYTNAVTQEPAGYKLTGLNRFGVKETNMLSQPGTKSESEGKWSIVRGTKSNPAAVVYMLNPGKPGIAIDMLKLSDSLLHILDGEGKLMIGNEFWSYTLNRVAN